MMPINSFFRRADPTDSTPSSKTPRSSLPCPGLDEKDHPRVLQYLDRTGAFGGGASSVTKIAFELYGKPYGKLSMSRKIQVKLAQRHDWKWRNEHDNGKVFSTTCTTRAVHSVVKSARPEPCASCREVLRSKTFKNAIALPKPPDERYKYLNREYRSNRLTELMGRCLQLREILNNQVNL